MSDPDPESSLDHSEAFAPLRVGGFRYLWTASLFGNLGSFFQITAGSWLMWELTASPAWVGWMTASRNLPLLVLALPAGVLADRIHRSRMLAGTQIAMGVSAAAMAVLTWMGWMNPVLLLALGMLLGIGNAFNAPTWQSMVPDLVPRALVTSAVALNSVSFNAARAIGPALGGVVVATLGAAAAFGLNAISYGVVVIAVLLVGRGLAAHDPDGSSVARAMVTGIKFARHTQAFRRVLALGTLFALGTAVLQAMLPVKAEEVGGDAGGYGLLLGMMGAGAALGGMTITRANRKLGSKSVPVTIALTGLSGASAGWAPTLAVGAASMFAVGIFWIWTLANLNASIQLMSPDWVRGRAVSLWLLAYAGMVPVGSILAGVIAERIGAGPTMLVLSTATIGLAVVSRIWRVKDPTSVEPPEFSPRRTHHHPHDDGGPVMIVNTWHIRDEDLPEFLSVMQRVRSARLATGGTRWQLYRDVDEPHAYTEAFVIATWDEHLRQHQRIDDQTARILAQARRLDESETGPISRHYIGVDLNSVHAPESWQELDQDHRAMHAVDGSVPLAKYRQRLSRNS